MTRQERIRENAINNGVDIRLDECGNWCIRPRNMYNPIIYVFYSKKEAVKKFRSDYGLERKHIFRKA